MDPVQNPSKTVMNTIGNLVKDGTGLVKEALGMNNNNSGSSSNSNSNTNSSNSNTNSNSNSNSNSSNSSNSNSNNEDIKQKPVVRQKQTIKQKLPYSPFITKQPKTIKEWADARKKFPNDFTYTEDGDLQVPPVLSNETTRIIEVPRFKPATAEYIQEYYKTRRAEAKDAENQYVNAKRNLQKAMIEYTAKEKSIDDVLDENQKVKDADAILNSKVKLPRKFTANDYQIITEGMLNFDWYQRKNPAEKIGITSYTFFPARGLWMPANENDEDTTDENTNTENTNEEDTNTENNNNKPKRNYTPQQLAIIRSKMARRSFK